MKDRKQLYKTSGYWTEKIENELFRKIYEYMEREGLNRTQLAERLGFHKSYITQMLNGDLNFSMKKLTELALKVGLVPELRLKSIEEYTAQEEARLAKYNFEDNNEGKPSPVLTNRSNDSATDHPAFSIKFKNKPIILKKDVEYA